MTADIPYMNSVKNVPAILDKIQTAGTPPKFTHDFLSKALGFASSSDRGFIRVLKTLGFLTQDGAPTARYNQFRSEGANSRAMAVGLREGWRDLFLADENAQERGFPEQTEMFKNITGKGEAVARKMASTFRALAERADWSAVAGAELESDMDNGEDELDDKEHDEVSDTSDRVRREREVRGDLSLHHDIHIHLPPSADVAVYTAIFRALREELRD